MKKKLILAGVVVSALCLTQFSACSDDDDEIATSVSGRIGNYSYVDLGLKSGLKWATYNVGANKPSSCGAYFTWANTKANSLSPMYSFRDGDLFYYTYTLYKYNTSSNYVNGLGTVDSLTVLKAADDAAAYNWGNTWRMPTKEELDELIDGCTWQWVKNGDISGQLGTSKSNGNTIFLPAAGNYTYNGAAYHSYTESSEKYYVGESGFYWTSSLCVADPIAAYSCSFSESGISTSTSDRRSGPNDVTGFPVRAVSE